MKFVTSALIATSAASFDGCHSQVGNQMPVLELEPVVLGTVSNGQSWKMEEGTNVVYIARVSGTAYEMGHAQGELLGKQIAANLNNIITYYRSVVVDFL